MLACLLTAHETRSFRSVRRQDVDTLAHLPYILEVHLKQPFTGLVLRAIRLNKLIDESLRHISLEGIKLFPQHLATGGVSQRHIRHILLAGNQLIEDGHNRKRSEDGNLLLWGYLKRSLQTQGI